MLFDRMPRVPVLVEGAEARSNFIARHLRIDQLKRQPPTQIQKLRCRPKPYFQLSTYHLTCASRRKLAAGRLSVPCYNSDRGGFVYVGRDWDNVPKENDLYTIFTAAERAGIIWLRFE